MDNKIELRFIDNEGIKEYWVDGYGSVFNHLSRKMIDSQGTFFYEQITPNAFDEVINTNTLNCIMNYQHDDTQILARTSSGTLILTVDEIGLKYSFKLPNTQLGNDVRELIERGDIYESSFAFIPDYKSIEITKHIDGTIIRTINKISGLFDCALVTNGAYSDTSITLYKRDYDDMINQVIEREYNEYENIQLKINLLKK